MTLGSGKEPFIGIIGLGIMGSAFASHLLSKGHKVHVYNRTREKAYPLVERGATQHDTPRELASAVDIIMTSVTDQDAVDTVALGRDGLLSGAMRGSLWIDLSTIDPEASIRQAREAEKRGVERLDTPVVGSRDLAEMGELIVLVGGKREVFQKREGFLKELGKTVIYLGPDGSGHKMKLAINLYLGLTAGAFSEALVLSEKQGLEAEVFVDTINKTPHANYFSRGKGPKIAEGDYEPAFSLSNLLKDLRLVSEQIARSGADLPLARVAIEEYSEAERAGNGEEDFSVIAREIERKNGLR